MNKKNKHTGHYVSLILILILGLIGLQVAAFDKKLQAEIIILTALMYVLWGIIHHKLNHSLSSKIVIEYILIAALGLAALMFFLMGIFGI